MNEEQHTPQQEPASSATQNESNGWGAISYISFFSLFALVTKKEDSFVQFHAKQGIALFIVEVVAVTLSFVLSLHMLANFILIVCTVLSIYGIITALRGERKDIPMASWLVEKLNI